MKRMDHIDLFTAVGKADDKYINEMLDEDIAEGIKKRNLQKRYIFAASAACAAVIAVSLTVNLLLIDAGGGIRTSDQRSPQILDDTDYKSQSVCEDKEAADTESDPDISINDSGNYAADIEPDDSAAENHDADAAAESRSSNNVSAPIVTTTDKTQGLNSGTGSMASIDSVKSNPQQLKDALLEIINNNNIPYTAGEFVSALTLDSTLKIAGVTIYKDGSAEDIAYNGTMNDDISSGAVSAIFDGASDGALTEYDGAAAEADRTEVKAQIRTDDESVAQDVQITVTSDGYINIDMDGSQFSYQADQSAAERVEEYFRQVSEEQ